MKLQPYQTIYNYPTSHINKMALDLVEKCGNIKSKETVLIYYDPGATLLAQEVARLVIKKGNRVITEVRDFDMEATIAQSSTVRDVKRAKQFLNSKVHSADSMFILRAVRDSNAFKNVKEENSQAYNYAEAPIVLDYRVDNVNWVLTWFPTPYEAKTEGLSYEDYYQLFYNACNLDWDKVKKEQETLIKLLDKGKEIQFTTGSGTDISMSIKDMTFANSTIDRNYPGSEVFSAPVKTSVNGKIVAPGKFIENGKVFEDITLTVKHGKIIDSKAKKGSKELIKILDTDEGSRYFGEVALGTNPMLRRPMLNPLLVEKVGGSFHMAIGRSYKFKEYGGKNVKLYNGNDSSIHWDLTIMMLKKYGGGEVKLDGKTISKDGIFNVEGIKYLNKGV